MTLPSSGPLTMEQINTEFGGVGNNLNAYRGRPHDNGTFPAGQISFSDFYGRSRRKEIDVTLTNVFNVNMRSVALSNGWNGTSPLDLTVRISGFCGSTDVSIYAFDTDTSYPSDSLLRLVVNGGSVVVGRGGPGGQSSGGRTCGDGDGNPGGNASPALWSRANVPFRIFNAGTISGGGGGGGGGGGDYDWHASGGGGGGGAGFGTGFPFRNYCGVTFDRAGGVGGNGNEVSGGGGGFPGNTGVGAGGPGGGLASQGRSGYMGYEPGNPGGSTIRAPKGAGRGGFGARAIIESAAITWEQYGDVRNAPPMYSGLRRVDVGGGPVQLQGFDPEGHAFSWASLTGGFSLSSGGVLSTGLSGGPYFVTVRLQDQFGSINDVVLEVFGYVPPPCFTGEALVTMADGSLKRIDEVLIGEQVLGAHGLINTVLGMHKVPAGGGHMHVINKRHRTSANHKHFTSVGWAALDTETADKPGNAEIIIDNNGTKEVRYNAKFVNGTKTTKLELGMQILTQDGYEVVESIDIDDSVAASEYVYSLVTDGSHAHFCNGFVVSAWATDKDFDYDTWTPRD